MKRFLVGISLVLTLSLTAQAQQAGAKPDDKAAAEAAKKAEAAKHYEDLLAAYMNGKWKDLEKICKGIYRHNRYFSRDQRLNVKFIRKRAKGFRPSWWKATRSASNVSFKAAIWGRSFMANYVPSSTLGVQTAYYDPYANRIDIIVSWRPEMVDNPKPLEGELAKRQGFTRGDLGEVIVWHELGHNYITKFLPVNQVVELYRNHGMLFHHLQEFYADMTALYHASPKAVRAGLMLRLEGMRENQENEEHNRASQAIASLLITNFLMEPDKWPNVHFPPEVPEGDIERKTMIYVYAHLDPKWTFDEDKALRKIIANYISKYGEKSLRQRGRITLPNKHYFMIMTAQDHEMKVKRDTWVRERLEAIIKAGRADKPPEKDKDGKPKREPLLEIEIPR